MRRSEVGWSVLLAYAAVCAATQVLWLTYAPIDTGSAHYYGVSTAAIGWLAEIFPLLYVVLAIPAGRLLDARFRTTLTAGGALTAAGALLRLGGPSFAWAMAGQAAVAVAQPLVLSAMGKLAAAYMPPARQPAGIAVASAASFVGMLAALALGPTLGGHGHIERLLVVEAILAILAALALGLALRRPATEEQESAAIERHVVRALWAQPAMRYMCGLVFVGFGVFVAIATWLQALLEPAGVSEATAGALLAA
jgi:predicted MFS family arabinose efflux permease